MSERKQPVATSIANRHTERGPWNRPGINPRLETSGRSGDCHGGLARLLIRLEQDREGPGRDSDRERCPSLAPCGRHSETSESEPRGKREREDATSASHV